MSPSAIPPPIGRTRENTVCLNFSPLVSRQHAIIRCHNGYQYQLIDLGSRNGTLRQRQARRLPAHARRTARASASRITNSSSSRSTRRVFRRASWSDASRAAWPARTTRRAAVAMLVCDMRGFSSMAEKIPSEQLAQTLGAWFRETGNIVQQQRRHDRQVHRRRDARLLGSRATIRARDAATAFDVAKTTAAHRRSPSAGPTRERHSASPSRCILGVSPAAMSASSPSATRRSSATR